MTWMRSNAMGTKATSAPQQAARPAVAQPIVFDAARFRRPHRHGGDRSVEPLFGADFGRCVCRAVRVQPKLKGERAVTRSTEQEADQSGRPGHADAEPGVQRESRAGPRRAASVRNARTRRVEGAVPRGVQRVAAGPGVVGEAPAAVHDVVNTRSAARRCFTGVFEPRFGRDLSSVRVHTIRKRPSRPQPSRPGRTRSALTSRSPTGSSRAGLREWAASPGTELTHVVQQTESADRRSNRDDHRPGRAQAPADSLVGLGIMSSKPRLLVSPIRLHSSQPSQPRPVGSLRKSVRNSPKTRARSPRR